MKPFFAFFFFFFLAAITHGQSFQSLPITGGTTQCVPDGEHYPNAYYPASVTVSGSIITFSSTGTLGPYPEWNPYYSGGGTLSNASSIRGFARTFTTGSQSWPFNTINRMTMTLVVSGSTMPGINVYGDPLSYQLGCFNKAIGTDTTYGINPSVDESGSYSHTYLDFNLTQGTWTIQADSQWNSIRGDNGVVEYGYIAHPTGEPAYNCFDTLTRFYVQVNGLSSSASATPVSLGVSQPVFWQQKYTESTMIYNMAAGIAPDTKTLYLSWCYTKTGNGPCSVYYSYSDMHGTPGFTASKLAPSGSGGFDGYGHWLAVSSGSAIRFTRNGGYNSMVYTTTNLDLSGSSGLTLYLAAQDELGSWKQIALPLPSQTPVPPPTPPTVDVSADVRAWQAAQAAADQAKAKVIQDSQPAMMAAPKRRQRR